MISCPRLLRLRGTGILNRIQKRAWPIQTDEEKTLWTSVSIDAVTPLFVIWTIGVVLATVLMFIERQTSNTAQGSSKYFGTSDRREPDGIRIG
jgi:hypothetical protein